MALHRARWMERGRAATTTLVILAAFVLTAAGQMYAAVTLSANLPAGTIGTAYSGSVTATGGVAPYSFKIVDGKLPSGLSLSSAGAVTGTPNSVVTKYFWVQGTDATGKASKIQTQVTINSAGGSGSGTISVAISPTTVTLASAATKQFSATVQGTTNTGVTWSTSAGTVSSSGLFTAPTVTANVAVTVTATSVADNTKKASATVSVTPPSSTISVTINPGSATVSSGNSQQFSATVSGTSNTAVTWSATSGAVSSGGLFTAPSVTSNSNVTVTATSNADTTKKSSATVTVMPPSNAGLAITTSSVPGAQSGSAYSYPLQASGGTVPYQWKVASGSLPQGFVLASTGVLSGTTTQTGTFSFSAQVNDAGNGTASKSFSFVVAVPPPPPSGGGSMDGPAQLPVTYMQTSLANTPASGSTITVGAGGSVSTALTNAQCGDTVQLAAGATFSGFTLPAKGCDNQHWIIVRTSAPDTALPPEGSRMLPCYAGVASLPGRPAFNCGSVTNVLAKVIFTGTGSGPIQVAPGANHYRLIGLEIARAAGTGLTGSLVSVGGSGTADHIILDRVWLHGTPQDDTMSGFSVNKMSYAALIDSYATDFHCTATTGACTDAHVVAGGTSTTPDSVVKVSGNFLEASGENVLFGGGYATTTPTDIEVRQNHFFKPWTWMKGQPGFVGGLSGNPFVVKNHLELKNAERVLIEGNIFENSWGGFSQVGYSILLTPKNQSGPNGSNICPICAVTDVTIRYNTISHVGAGISMANVKSDNGGVALAGERYSIHDITVDDVSASKYNGSGTLFMVLSWWPTNSLNSITINHVTGFPDPMSRIIDLGNGTANPPMYGFIFTNNIIGHSAYPIWSTGGGTANCAYTNVPVTNLPACFTSYKFIDNAMIAVNTNNFPASAWPSSNYFPTSVTNVQFVNFNNGIGGNYALLSGSPYSNAGSDGKDLGADLSAIQSLIAGVY